jgi:hypothetical protein
MIKDVVIIKDGLPLLSKNFSNTNNAFSRNDNLIMMSGFFSALESFSTNFEGLGDISELKLANNDTKLSFLREPSFPNLIYLATYDENSKSVNVQRFLRKVSNNFLRLYNTEQILNWRGRKDAFEGFKHFLSQYIEEESEEIENNFKEKVIDLFDNVKEKIAESGNINSQIVFNEEISKNKSPEYYSCIPCFKTSKKIEPRYFLSGKTSCNVFNSIDGKKSIDQIAKELNLNQKEVHNICKNLVKLGFINLKEI